jgi:hypothetical protein
MNVNTDSAYLALAGKVKDIGLNAVLGIAQKSGITPIQLDPVDTGLNAIMSIKRNRGAVNRGMAEKASQTILYSRPRRMSMQRSVDATTTNMLVTNSTITIMTAPIPLVNAQTFVPRLSSTPKVVIQSPDDMDLLRTLPSVTAKTTIQPKLVQRPDSLALPKMNSIITSSSDKDVSTVSYGGQPVGCYHKAVPASESAPTVADDGLSSGLLRHLSSIYTKTRGLMDTPAAAFGSSLYKD